MTGAPRSRLALAAVLLLTAILGARGITDEAAVMLGGDMARYLMNGVFIHDLIADGGVWSIGDLTNYAERYYARYPALSLGHHPPLPSIVLVPFFFVFGISVFAARLAALGWFLFAAWGLYAFARRLFDWQVAAWTTTLFVTNVMVLRAGQYVLSEMPMLALVLLSLNALWRYCDTRKASHFVWFVAAVVASLTAKQLAVFVFPAYAAVLVMRLGWRSLVSRHVMVMAVFGFLIVAPFAVMTLMLAPLNVSVVTNSISRLAAGTRESSVATLVTTAVGAHLSVPMLIVVSLGAAALIRRRDRRVAVLLLWIVTVIGATVVFAGTVETARYTFGAMPAYFLLAGGLATAVTTRPHRRAVMVVLAACVFWQAWLVATIRPSGAGGYEAAARWVVDHSATPTVLFDTAVDSGYFAFFVRKHDPNRRLVLLRADKLEPPGGRETRLQTPEQLYGHLRRFGIRFVVVEDHQGMPRGLPSLRAELRTDRFVEWERIPIDSNDRRIRGVALAIYEFRDAQPADLDAEVDIGIPLGRREIRLRLRDLIGTGGQR